MRKSLFPWGIYNIMYIHMYIYILKSCLKQIQSSGLHAVLGTDSRVLMAKIKIKSKFDLGVGKFFNVERHIIV